MTPRFVVVVACARSYGEISGGDQPQPSSIYADVGGSTDAKAVGELKGANQRVRAAGTAGGRRKRGDTVHGWRHVAASGGKGGVRVGQCHAGPSSLCGGAGDRCATSMARSCGRGRRCRLTYVGAHSAPPLHARASMWMARRAAMPAPARARAHAQSRPLAPARDRDGACCRTERSSRFCRWVATSEVRCFAAAPRRARARAHARPVLNAPARRRRCQVSQPCQPLGIGHAASPGTGDGPPRAAPQVLCA